MLATGEFIFSLDLLSAAAIGQGSWKFSLQYLSNNGVSDIVGLYWNYSQNYQLVQLPNGDIILLTPDNLQETFIYNGNGWLSGYNSTQATLVEINAGTANDTFILTSNAGTVTEFFGFYSSITTPGRVKSITDRYGNGQSLTWASVGGVMQLSSVTDSYGRTTNYSYYGSTGNYLLSQITDFMGRQLNFYYDAAGHLTAVILPNINNTASGNAYPNGTAYVFQYDVSNADPNRQNDLIKIWYPNQTLPYMSSRNVDIASVYANATPRYVIAYGQTSTDLNYGAVVSETVGDPANGVGGTYTFTYSNTNLPANIIDPTDPIVSQTTMTDRNGNVKVFNFNYNGMVVMKQENTNRNKSSLEVGPYITWTQYNDQNQKLLEVLPAGNSIAYTYDTGMIDFGSGPQLYPPRRGLLLSETHYPGNSIGVPSRPGSNGQTQLTKTYFYDPIYNLVCAEINEKGNPITISSGANVYFTPQNGGTTPTNANRSRYATITTFDYQKNQTSTITGSSTLQNLLGLTAAQIQSLITYASNQMIAGGLPNGFQTNLGDINGDGTGDGNSSGLAASPMLGSPVQIQHPAVYQLVPNPNYPGSGDPWLWQTQNRLELFTNNLKGQTTTHTNPEGNLTIYVRFPENNPDGDFDYYDPNLSSNQYGRVKEIHVDADPSTAMTLVGSEGDMVAFTGNIIPRTNTPGVYQNLTTTHQGATGCTTCNYDPLGNILTTVDARGNLTKYDRTEMGEVYRVTVPAPYSYLVETFYDANRNRNRVDTQDMVVLYTSTDPSDPNYAKFTPSGSGSTANVPLTAGPGGSVRPGWFTNLYTFDILDNKIEDDLDATGSSPSSLITSYAFDANENVIQITKPNGNTIQYDYDERNLRIAIRTGYAPNLNPPVAGAVVVSVFDANGNLLDVIGPAQRGTSNNSLSVTIANAFNSGNSLTQTGDWLLANTLDGFDRAIAATDAVGGGTNNTFDPTGQNIQRQMLGSPNGPTPTDRTGSGNVPLELAQTRYDEGGRPYESQRSVFLNTGLSGGVPTNNIPSGRAVTHTGGGLAANSTTNSNTATVTLTTGGQSYTLTRTVFDRAGRATNRGDDNGAISTVAYDGANRRISETDAAGNVTQYTFDANGNPTGVTRVEQCTISSSIAAESFGSLLMYDVMNQLVVRADQGADGTLSGNFSDTSTLFTFHGYNSRGNQTNIIDPKQNTTIMVFDGAGRRLQIQQNLRTGGSGSNPIVSTVLTQYGFDGNGNQIRLMDSNSGTTTWAFDTLDRKISETYQDGSTKEFVYDLASDVVTYTDENGSVFSNTWDCMGRKTNVSIAPASGIGGTTAQSFQYNGLAQTTFARDTANGNNADVTLVYDSIQRTVEESQTYGGNTRYVTNGGFTSLPVSQFTFPNARQINNSFDALYRRQQIIEAATSAVIASWQYFGPSRIATVTLGNGLLCSNMNNAQTRSAIQSGLPTPAWGSISTDQLGYDGAGRIIGKRYFNGSNVIVGFTSAYDMSSNKYFERPLHAEERSSLYDSYDSMNRLLDYQRGVLASGGGSVSTPITLPNTDSQRNYNLDALGNWTSSVYTPEGGSQIPDQRNHNKLNEIIQRTVGTSPAVTFQYDGASGASNGNLANDGTLIYFYDALNRPIELRVASYGGVIAVYTYDAMNRRVRKNVGSGGLPGDVPNGTTDYIYMGNQVMEDRNPFGGGGSTDTPIRQYAWGTYIDECIQLTTLAVLGPQSLPAGAYYLLQDLLYRAVALTNASGAIVEAYDTDAYGNTLIFTGPGADGVWFTDDDVQSSYGANEIIFCGYRYDPESELYYVRNRTYNPVLGRWVQRDPIGYAGGVNLYEYVGGQAVLVPDSSGLWPGPCCETGSGCCSYTGSFRLQAEPFEPGFIISFIFALYELHHSNVHLFRLEKYYQCECLMMCSTPGSGNAGPQFPGVSGVWNASGPGANIPVSPNAGVEVLRLEGYPPMSLAQAANLIDKEMKGLDSQCQAHCSKLAQSGQPGYLEGGENDFPPVPGIV